MNTGEIIIPHDSLQSSNFFFSSFFLFIFSASAFFFLHLQKLSSYQNHLNSNKSHRSVNKWSATRTLIVIAHVMLKNQFRKFFHYIFFLWLSSPLFCFFFFSQVLCQFLVFFFILIHVASWLESFNLHHT